MTPSPILPQICTPTIYFQWEGWKVQTPFWGGLWTDWAVNSSNDVFRGCYTPEVENATTPTKTQKWDQCILTGNKLGYMFDTKYLNNHARYWFGFKRLPLRNHVLQVMTDSITWPQKVMVMNPKSLRLHTSTAVQDKKLTTYTKPCIASQMVTWLMMPHDSNGNNVRSEVVVGISKGC